MSEGANEAAKTFNDSTFKWPRPFGNVTGASAYPPWTPVDTKKRTAQVFRVSFYTTLGAYTWLYIWKRTAFKLGLPLAAIGFATTATAAKGMITNLREKNDGWNTFWGVATGNLVVLTAGFRSMPVRHKIMTGLGGAALAALLDHISWSESTSYAAANVKHEMANTGKELPKQEFWDVWRRRPLSQTVEELGSGRGIFKA